MRQQLCLLLLAAVVVSAVGTRGFGPPDFETEPLSRDALKGVLGQSQGILQATSAQPQEFAFHTSEKAPVEAPSLVQESEQVKQPVQLAQSQAPALVEESMQIRHGVSHHLRSLDGLQLHTKADMQATREYSKLALSFMAQFVMENYPEEMPSTDAPIFVEEEEEAAQEDVDHGETGRFSDRQSRRQWRKMNRGKMRFQEQAGRRERGRVPSEAARDIDMPVFLEEKVSTSTALEQVDLQSLPMASTSTVMVELEDAVRAHQRRGGVMEKLKLMTYGGNKAEDNTADDTEDLKAPMSVGVDHEADTESLSGGLTPYKMRSQEVEVSADPKTLNQDDRFEQVDTSSSAKAKAKDMDDDTFIGAIGKFVKGAVNKVKSVFTGKKDSGAAPAKATNEGAVLEDCVGCRMVWQQVELDVGNARYIEDIQASFEHNCMDAQKSTIFYAVCEDMYDDMYALTDDYMASKYKVVDMCKRGKYCTAG